MVGSAQTTENQALNNNEKQERKLMGTPKKDKKPAAKVTETGDGVKVVGHRALTTDKDGNMRDATLQEMAAAKGAYITVASKSENGIEVVATYDCCIQHYDNGNIGLFIRTSDSLDDAEVDNPVAKDLSDGIGKNDKLTLVGRGNSIGAAFALTQCYRAYSTPFGQASAYRMVKMTLDKETKLWRGLFVPALAVASM
jgi:hypothetical protein